MLETGFASPEASLFDEVVAEALRAAGERVTPEYWERVTHGSANLVILTGRTAVRVSRTPSAGTQAERAQRLIDGLPELQFAVPRSLADPVRCNGFVAIAQRRITGDPHPAGDGDPKQLRSLLDVIHDLSLESVRAHLAAARSFMGGDRWFQVMTEEATPMLALRTQGRARRAAEALATLEPVAPSFTHGDLAGANVLWESGRVVGVLDWDLASVDDPAEDVAAIGNWHGWQAASQAAIPEVVRRARVFAATYSLQVICFAILNGRPQVELDRAVERANLRFAN